MPLGEVEADETSQPGMGGVECVPAPKPLPTVEEETDPRDHLHEPMIEVVGPENRVVHLQGPIECFPHAALAHATATSTSAT